MTKGKCSRTGKIKYASEASARASMRYLRRHGRTNMTDAYLCSFCDEWHLTSTERKR